MVGALLVLDLEITPLLLFTLRGGGLSLPPWGEFLGGDTAMTDEEAMNEIHKMYERWKDDGILKWSPRPINDEERMASDLGKRLFSLREEAKRKGIDWELVKLFATLDGKAGRLLSGSED